MISYGPGAEKATLEEGGDMMSRVKETARKCSCGRDRRCGPKGVLENPHCNACYEARAQVARERRHPTVLVEVGEYVIAIPTASERDR